MKWLWGAVTLLAAVCLALVLGQHSHTHKEDHYDEE